MHFTDYIIDILPSFMTSLNEVEKQYLKANPPVDSTGQLVDFVYKPDTISA